MRVYPKVAGASSLPLELTIGGNGFLGKRDLHWEMRLWYYR